MRFSKWNDYDVDLAELLQSYKNCTDTEIAKKLLMTNEGGNINRDVDLLRTYIKRHRARLLDQHEGIYNATNDLDVPNTSVKHMWLKTKQSSIFVKNPEYIEPQTEVELEKEIDFTNIFKDLVKPIKFPKIESKLDLSIFDRLVYTDVHI
jgi:hypothetical protein